MKRGFTLVELSIVLVVIGLLIGGILAAQSMIGTAKIQSQIRQMQQIQVAITNFNTKYSCLPGDCTSFPRPGNGDGYVYGSADSTTPAAMYSQWGGYEYSTTFKHLIQAQMFPFADYDATAYPNFYYAGTGYPLMVIQDKTSGSPGSGGIVFGYEAANAYVEAGHKLRLAACWDGSQPSFSCNLNAIDALAIDTKLDDGKPYSGKVVITSSVYIYNMPGSIFGNYDTTGNCGNSASNSYQNSTTANCSVEFNIESLIR